MAVSATASFGGGGAGSWRSVAASPRTGGASRSIVAASPKAAGDPGAASDVPEVRTESASAPPAPSPASATSASASSRALWKRFSMSRERARSKKRSTSGPRPSTIPDASGMGSAQIATSTSPISSPGKGSVPVRQRKAMTPSDQRSLR